jgi:hypothetical protein
LLLAILAAVKKAFFFWGLVNEGEKNANLLPVPPRPELNSKIRTWRTCPSSFAGLELDSTVLAAGLVRHFWNRGRVTRIGSS